MVGVIWGVILGILVHWWATFWESFGVFWEHFGINFGHFGAVLSPQMEPKSTWGHLWGPVAPPGSPQWGSGGSLGFILEFVFDQKTNPKNMQK